MRIGNARKRMQLFKELVADVCCWMSQAAAGRMVEFSYSRGTLFRPELKSPVRSEGVPRTENLNAVVLLVVLF